MSLQHWLHQPFPFSGSWRAIWKNSVYSGLFVAAFLFLFRPFGIQVPDGEEMFFLFICLGFGLVTFLTVWLVHAGTRFFPAIFREETWVVWKEIAFNLFFIGLIGLGNFLFAHIIFHSPLAWKQLLVFQVFTFAIGAIPAVFGAYTAQARLERRYNREAKDLNAHMHPEGFQEKSEPITLSGDNQGEQISLPAHHILYLAAADNYVQVFFLENDQLRQKMLRSTLKKLEETLTSHPQFFRCHRAYIVNLDKVQQASGNAQGYRLHLGVPDTDPIPVSRNLNDLIREKFSEK